jgi:hypothetical protein
VRRHDLDLTSLLAGIVFAAVAVAGLASPGLDLVVDPLWLVPGVLVALGLAGLLGTWSRMRRDTVAGAAPRDATPAGTTTAGTADATPSDATPSDATPTDTTPTDPTPTESRPTGDTDDD